MKRSFTATPARLAVLTLAVSAAGCSTISDWFSGDKSDYKTSTKSQPLEVPPDLTQLARDSRYQPQGGVVSAAGAASAASNSSPAVFVANNGIAPNSVGAVHVERAGQQRWLVVPVPPEQLWPQVKAFWEQGGFTLAQDDARTGIMETNWAENRTKLPTDIIRSTIGKVFGNLFDTGERDLYRTRIERTATGSEVYITHRGLIEVYTDERKENVAWRPRANDPQLEAEQLSRLMIALGTKDEPAAKATIAAAAEAPTKARAVDVATSQATTLVVDDGFDRAWRRVGLALDRGGFTVEDRDRTAGLYYVRYVDPKNAGKDEPGWWSKLFGDGKNPQAAVRYRILLKGDGDSRTNLSVQTSAGTPDTGENAKRIVGILTNELR